MYYMNVHVSLLKYFNNHNTFQKRQLAEINLYFFFKVKPERYFYIMDSLKELEF